MPQLLDTSSISPHDHRQVAEVSPFLGRSSALAVSGAGVMDQRLRRARTIAAWALLVAACIGWPVTAVLQWLGYHIFEQVMIGLSWVAVIVVCADLLTSSQVHEEQGNGD